MLTSKSTLNGQKIQKFYVRIALKGIKSDKYRTLGPYLKPKAYKLMINYLSTGICSWMEKID